MVALPSLQSVRYPEFSRGISSRWIFRLRYLEDIQLVAVVHSTLIIFWSPNLDGTRSFGDFAFNDILLSDDHVTTTTV
jgi:hypothetical protein